MRTMSLRTMRTMMRLWVVAFGFWLLIAGAAAAVEAIPAPRGPYLLADAETGAVFEHFDALRPWYPASTTKLMTIYVVFRAVAGRRDRRSIRRSSISAQRRRAAGEQDGLQARHRCSPSTTR